MFMNFFSVQIFPSEVNNILLSHPGVVDSATVGVDLAMVDDVDSAGDSDTVGVNHSPIHQVPHCFVVRTNEDDVTEYMMKQALYGNNLLNCFAH